ncbi:MAG: hypothetical protein JXA03_12065 [Bacteroidales bacterium]|nr:hypothetical protein [Bacteroidales bacterium]
MKTILNLAGAVLISAGAWAQITTDTTYMNQWNSKSSAWDQFDRTIEYYNQDIKISELTQVFDQDRWINYSFKAITYGKNGEISEEVEQFWNDLQLRWEDNTLIRYQYDKEGNLTEILYQNIYNGLINNGYREVFSYYADNKVKEKIRQHFENSWGNFLKTGYIYNQDLLSEETICYWEDNKWSSSFIVDKHRYNPDGKLVSKMKSKVENGNETNISKEEYIINTYGMLEELTVSRWNEKKSSWINENKVLFSNDLSGNTISCLSMTWQRNQWSNYMFTEFSNGKIINLRTPLEHEMTFTITANPYRKIARIEFENPGNESFVVKVVDQNGKLVNTCHTSGNLVKFENMALDSGLYYVEFQGNEFYSGKFSIE